MATLAVTNPDPDRLVQGHRPRRQHRAGDRAAVADERDHRRHGVEPRATCPPATAPACATTLPSGTWRRFNEGVAPTKSTAVQITDSCGMLETYSEIDKALARPQRQHRRLSPVRGSRLPRGPDAADGRDAVLRQHVDQSRALHGVRPALQHDLDRGRRRPPTTSSAAAVPAPTTRRSGWSAGATSPCTASSPRAARPACR